MKEYQELFGKIVIAIAIIIAAKLISKGLMIGLGNVGSGISQGFDLLGKRIYCCSPWSSLLSWT